MAKTNIGLVEYAKAQIGNPYWYGTFGNIATETLLRNKSIQYPSYYSPSSRITTAKAKHMGKRVHDCVGLIKGYLWSETPLSVPKYNSSQDVSANGMLSRCTQKGAISTMPDTLGILVFMNGHVGVYIGNGEVVEARGFDYGVVKTKLKDRAWANWGQCPYITYENIAPVIAPTPAPTPAPVAPTPQPTIDNATINVHYQVYDTKWLGWINNYNTVNGSGYAGNEGKGISGVRAYCDRGHIKYRVHTINGKWWGWITDYNTSNSSGYAGVLGKNIDMIQMQLVGLPDYNVKYRVSNTNSNDYLGWVTNYQLIGSNGYAGIRGKAIDKLQVEIVKK